MVVSGYCRLLIPLFWGGPKTASTSLTPAFTLKCTKVCKHAFGTSPTGLSVKNLWKKKKGVCVSRAVHTKLASIQFSSSASQQVLSTNCFFCIFPVLVLDNWVVVSALVFDIVANTVGLRTLPIWGEIHPASLSKVLTSLQGTSWAVGQVWSQLIVLVLDLFLALSLLFCSLSLLFNFDSPLLCPLQGFA